MEVWNLSTVVLDLRDHLFQIDLIIRTVTWNKNEIIKDIDVSVRTKKQKIY